MRDWKKIKFVHGYMLSKRIEYVNSYLACEANWFLYQMWVALNLENRWGDFSDGRRPSISL